MRLRKHVSMDYTTNDYPPPASGRQPAGPGRSRFFGWMRGLGIVRHNGWIGGVCAGIAARLGIDPLIVRGIAVVVAILGGPAFLLYAAAWLLLPDADDDIHLERLLAGVFEPAIIGIGVLLLLIFLPTGQGVWWAGGQFWGRAYWPQSLGHALWSLVIIAAIVAFIIWMTRRSRWTSAGGGTGARTASARPAAGGTDATPSGTDAPPPAPAGGDSGTDFDEWKARQQEWRQQHAAWRAQADAEQRAVRERRSAELRAQSRQIAAQAQAERRARRAANPRTGAAFVAITFGVALLAGGIVAAVATATPEWHGYEVTMGFASATLAVGLAMILAGALRRRSGFLAFVAIVLSIVTVLTALPPRDRDFVLAYGRHDGPGSARLFEPFGGYSIRVSATDAAASKPAVIDLQQWFGAVDIAVLDDASVRVERVTHDGDRALTGVTLPASGHVTTQNGTPTRLRDGTVESVLSYGSGAPDVIVRVEQNRGYVNVQYYPGSGADQTRSNQ